MKMFEQVDSDGNVIRYDLAEVSSLLIKALERSDREAALLLCDGFLSLHGERLMKQLLNGSVGNIMRMMFLIGYYSAKLNIKEKKE